MLFRSPGGSFRLAPARLIAKAAESCGNSRAHPMRRLERSFHDKDINIISKIIGENISSVDELQSKIQENYEKVIPKISVIFEVYC